jgi:hypothetical protein
LDMLNRLMVNSDNLLTLKLAGCFQLLADPREQTERTAKLRSLAWGDRDRFVRSTEPEPDDDYDVNALLEHKDKLDGDGGDEANGDQTRRKEDRRLLAHRVNVRELTSRLHTVTTLNLSGPSCPLALVCFYFIFIIGAWLTVHAPNTQAATRWERRCTWKKSWPRVPTWSTSTSPAGLCVR